MSTGVSGVAGGGARVIVVGAGGRMGARVCALAHAEGMLIGAVERAGSAEVGRRAATDSGGREAVNVVDSGERFARGSADVVIDFSHDSAAKQAVSLAARVGCGLLVGTTGLTPPTLAMLREESKLRAILVAPNTSLGVAVLADLARRAAAMLSGYECSIVESHHSLKKDAPSGTALRLADALRSGGGKLSDAQVVSIRGGDVVGEHTVRLAGPGEYIELTHRATSRDVFARGALRCATWLKGRAAGWWTMEDVLGLPPR